MTVVQECLGHPHQVPVQATLWGVSEPVVGLHTPTNTLVTTFSTHSTGASGCWSLDLPPNSEIEPSNTLYRITRDDFCGEGRTDYVTFISVPATGGPYLAWDLQQPPPGPFPLFVGNLEVGNTLIVNGVDITPYPLSSLPDAVFPWDGDELLPMQQDGVGVKVTTEKLLSGPIEVQAGPNRMRMRYASDLYDFDTTVTVDASRLGFSQLRTSLAGTGSQVAQAAGLAEFGIADVTAGTATTGRAAIGPHYAMLYLFSNAALIRMGARVKMPVVTDGTNTYRVVIGHCDITSIAGANGFFFRSPTAAGNWQAVIRSASADLAVIDTGVACDFNGAFHTFTVEFDPVFSGARFYIDGVLVASDTTNEPAAAASMANIGVGIIKSAGASTRIVKVDTISWDFPYGPTSRWGKMP